MFFIGGSFWLLGPGNWLKMFSIPAIAIVWCLAIPCLIPRTDGQIATGKLPCDLAGLYNSGTCRRDGCLEGEHYIPGNNYCDAYSLLYSVYYTRCFPTKLCCWEGGNCRAQCHSGETTLAEVTDCRVSGTRCCVPPHGATVSARQGACGSGSRLTPRIVGGAPAQRSNWPWMVRIIFNAEVKGFCSGVFVDDDTVLTVASCLEGMSNSDIQVLFRDYNIEQDETGELLVPVRSIERSADYKKGNIGGNLAVLKLARGVALDSSISPACLPDPTIPIVGMNSSKINDVIRRKPKASCYIAGWGQAEDGRIGPTLREASVTLMAVDTCAAVLGAVSGHFSSLPSNVICTDTSATNADGCKYDDGGMLVCLDEKGRYPLVGLISQYSCGRLPTIYTRISSYIEFILARL